MLDVGAGGGRFALPMALKSKSVATVEPSDAMVEQLRSGMDEAGVSNVSVVHKVWEEAKVEPADIVICAHVVYGVAKIEPFLRKLTTHARRRVLVLAFTHPPISRFSPFWKPVHGEERIEMPALPEIVNVLWEMDIYPNVDMLEEMGQRGFSNREEALNQLRQRVYVQPGTEKDERLLEAMNDLLVETSDGLTIKGANPRYLGLVSWVPE